MSTDKLQAQNSSQNPYVGPRALKDGELLCGRDREVQELMDLLIAERIVLLHSPSGAGKTSLLQAGLIPRLIEEGFDVLPIIRVSLADPSQAAAQTGDNRYILSTIQSIESRESEKVRDSLSPTADLKTYLDERSERNKRRYQPVAPLADSQILQLKKKELLNYLSDLARAKGDDNAEVMIFDQFEEILTLNPIDNDAKRKFFEEVGNLLRDRNRWAIFSMREDYVAALDPYIGYIPTRLSTNYRLDLLDETAARAAIQGPVEQFEIKDASGKQSKPGIKFAETPDAIGLLIEDLQKVRIRTPEGFSTGTGRYVEPVQLQVVCRRLWETMYPMLMPLPPKERLITRDHVQEFGQINEALGGFYADAVTAVSQDARINIPERVIRNWFETEMITPQGLRNLVLLGVSESKGLHNDAVEQLTHKFLVREERRQGIIWLELTHDRLIEPIRKNNKDWYKINMPSLERQAKTWRESGRSNGLLLLDEALKEAEKTFAEIRKDLMPEQQKEVEEFLEESRKWQAETNRKARQMKRIKYAAMILVVLLLISIVSLSQSIQKTSEAQDAQTKALLAQLNAEMARSEAVRLKAKAVKDKEKLEETNKKLEDEKQKVEDQKQENETQKKINDQQGDEIKKQEGIISEKEKTNKRATDELEDNKKRFAEQEERFKAYEEGANAKLAEKEGILKKQTEALEHTRRILLSNSLAVKAAQRLNEDSAAMLKDGQRYALASNYEFISPIGRDALVKALQLSPIQQSFGSPGQIQATAFAQQADQVIAITKEGAINPRLEFKVDADQNTANKLPQTSESTAPLWLKPLKDQSIATVVISEEGNRVAVAREVKKKKKASNQVAGAGEAKNKNEEIVIYNLEKDGSVTEHSVIEGHQRGTVKLALSDDGNYVATANNFGNFAVTNIDKQAQIPARKRRWSRPHWLTKARVRFPKLALGSEPFRNVTAFAFSHALASGNRFIAVAYQTGEIAFYDVQNKGKNLFGPIGNLVGDSLHSEITSIAFNADNSMMAIGSRDKTAKVYIFEDNQGRQINIAALDFSPEAFRNLRLRPLFTGPLEGHRDAVISVAFNPMKNILATGSQDQTVILWDLSAPHVANCDAASATSASNDSRKLIEISGHKGYVNSLSFSRDGNFLVTGSADNSTKVWKIGAINELRKLKCLVEQVKAIKVEGKDQSPSEAEKQKLREAGNFIKGLPLAKEACGGIDCPDLDRPVKKP